MNEPCFLARKDFQTLLDRLADAGYQCLGPQVRDGAIVYDVLDRVEQLPVAIHDRQSPGHYQLEHSDGERYFAWANGPQALKPLSFAPRESLWTTERDAAGKLQFVETLPSPAATAVIGVRSCDLAALKIQDRVFLESDFKDPYYQRRREALFTVAVNCSHPAATCFCASTGDGPVAKSDFDLLLTELDDGFLIEADSEAGYTLLKQLPLKQATDQQHYLAGQQHLYAEEVQRRSLPGRNLRDVLAANLNHPRWDDVAERCLSCGNCTMVCPTCFCHGESEHPQLDGNATEHLREWDSCFTEGHSYIHGTVVRDQTRLRYRQWLTHKLGTWHDQFGSSGCVGCGRCISWCPAAIDLTEEVAVICGDGNE